MPSLPSKLSWESACGFGGTACMISLMFVIAFVENPSELRARELVAQTPLPIPSAPARSFGAPPATTAKPEAASAGQTARDAELVAMAADNAMVNRGRQYYAMFCTACHGAADIGGESPSNLFDLVWFHGGTPAQIEKTIRQGVPETQMPPWDAMLPDDQILALTAYLYAGKP